MNKVQIYTTATCPYCHAAKSLLEKKEVDYHEISVADPIVREKMMQRANGRRSVPQIFIGTNHIGGFDDMVALDRAGKLDILLKEK